MWLMLQQPEPDDYVVATNETHSVREFAEATCNSFGIDLRWQGYGLDEVGVDEDGRAIIRIDPQYFRPAEVDLLIGDYSKAREKLGWEPQTRFEDLVGLMAEADLEAESRKARLEVVMV
jgi:GDPmannose 4,6-dehydratase